jgi:hypothetical protein
VRSLLLPLPLECALELRAQQQPRMSHECLRDALCSAPAGCNPVFYSGSGTAPLHEWHSNATLLLRQLVDDITRGRSVYCPSYVAHCTLAYRRKPRTRWNDTALLLWLLYLQQRAADWIETA